MSDPDIQEYTVISVHHQQLWAQDDAGEMVRAWAPPEGVVGKGVRVRIYLGERLEPLGWHDPASGQAVNQRYFDGTSPPTPRGLTCTGDCGLVWEAPAAAAIMVHHPHCLQCGGKLRPE